MFQYPERHQLNTRKDFLRESQRDTNLQHKFVAIDPKIKTEYLFPVSSPNQISFPRTAFCLSFPTIQVPNALIPYKQESENEVCSFKRFELNIIFLPCG